MKRLTTAALFVALAFSITAPAAYAGSKQPLTEQQKEAQKEFSKSQKNAMKAQKKQAKEQKKQLKEFKKQHKSTTTVT